MLKDKAKNLAEKGHKGQKRKYIDVAYIEHPKAVVALLDKWGVDDDEVLAASFAHDLLEDTNISESTIKRNLGNKVLSLVEELTKPSSGDKQQWIDNMSKQASARAILIKAADRLANTRDFLKSNHADYAENYLNKAEKVFRRLKSESGKLGSKVVKNALKELDLVKEEIRKAKTSSLVSELKEIRSLCAFEFPNEKALKRYLKNHPKADPRHHTVVKQDEQKSKPDSKTKQKSKPESKKNIINPGDLKIKDKATPFTPQEHSLQPVARQKVNTMEEVYKQADEAQEQMLNWLDRGQGVDKQLGLKHFDIASGNMPDLNQEGPILITAPKKGKERAREKIEGEEGGDWSRLTDVVRASIGVDNYEDIPNVIETLRKSGMKLASKPTDRFAQPTPSGYRDIKLNVEYPNGHVGELQVHTKSMLRAKEQAHKDYETVRSIDAKAALEKRSERTEEEQKLVEEAVQKMKQTYDQAWQESLGQKKSQSKAAKELISRNEAKHYMMDDQPVRVESKRSYPVMITPDGSEKRIYNYFRFLHEAREVNERVYKKKIKEIKSKKGSSTGKMDNKTLHFLYSQQLPEQSIKGKVKLENDLASELIKVAQLLLSKKLDEKDNLIVSFNKLIDSGETAEFEYTKKDGSTKKREIVPLKVFKMKGRWVVKGYETKDPRKTEKVFYLDMIGDVEASKVEKKLSLKEMKDKIFEVYEDQIYKAVDEAIDDAYDYQDDSRPGNLYVVNEMNPKKWAVIYHTINNGKSNEVHLISLRKVLSRGRSDSAWYQKVTLYLDVNGVRDENNRWDKNNKIFSGFANLGRKWWDE